MLQAVKRAVFSVCGPDAFLTCSAIWNIHRKYEPAFQEFLSMLPLSGTLLDVGANIGITCAIARRRRPDLHLIAFEPVPRNVKILRRMQVVYRIKQMDIHPVAVGETEGKVSITTPMSGGLINASLSHIASETYDNAEVESLPVFQTVEVNIRSLDSFHFERVDAIKIDVEGHELQVLAGAKQLLSVFRPTVFCEIWNTPRRKETINFMESFGYTVAQLGDDDFLFTPSHNS